LSSRGRVVAYDQVPYGLSEKLLPGDWNGDNPYSPASAVDQLFALLDELGLDRVYLVGSSYGGNLAIRAAARDPQRVEGLILVDPAVYAEESMPAWLVNSPQMQNLGPYMARSMGSGDAFFETCYSDPSFFSGERKDTTKILTRIENWDAALWQYLAAWGLDPVDYDQLLPTLEIPALVVSGSLDAVIPPEDSRKVHELLPISEYREIEGSGHLPHEERPGDFLEAVFEWLDTPRRL
jgi:pimeloyl-ACP methyl ester carboxylesterase